MTDQPPPADAQRVPAPPLGAADPLSAAYCAERAAAAIHAAEHADDPARVDVLLGCAGRWRDLAEKLATHPAMSRPRDRDNDTRR